MTDASHNLDGYFYQQKSSGKINISVLAESYTHGARAIEQEPLVKANYQLHSLYRRVSVWLEHPPRCR